jgi:hypothetical protein
MKEFNNSES